MVVKLKPETESPLQKLAATTGRAPDELIEDAMNGYVAEIAKVRAMIGQRYDGIKNGSVTPVDGDQAFAQLRKNAISGGDIIPNLP